MNQRPTSFMLRDKITFSEQESRYLKIRHALQKHQNQHHIHPRPEFNHSSESDETQTEVIPNIPPSGPSAPSGLPSGPSAPSGLPSGPSAPSRPLSDHLNPIGWGPRIYDLGSAIHKVVGSPLESPTIDSMMEDAQEALASLGL